MLNKYKNENRRRIVQHRNQISQVYLAGTKFSQSRHNLIILLIKTRNEHHVIIQDEIKGVQNPVISITNLPSFTITT